jgi:hypothetical protein
LGVFAGRSFSKGDIIDRNAAVVVPTGQVYSSQIGNYVFGGRFSLESWLVLGSGSLCNYCSKPNALLAWNDSSDKASIYLIAQEAIVPGDEIFVSYGGDEWFSDRGLELLDADARGGLPPGIAPRQRRCLSDVYIGTSKIPGAGNGAFASRSFSKGDIISTAPVIAVPKLRFINTDLKPYLVGTQTLDIAFIPVDKLSMANHNGSNPNLMLCWFHGDEANVEDMCNIMPEVLEMGFVDNKNDLVKQPFAHLYVAYVARRDITAGDELTVSYYGNNEPIVIDCSEASVEGGATTQDVTETADKGSADEDCDPFPMEWKAHSPIPFIDMSPDFFTPEFILAEYEDTFVKDARRMLESLDTAKMLDFFTSKIQDVSDRILNMKPFEL